MILDFRSPVSFPFSPIKKKKKKKRYGPESRRSRKEQLVINKRNYFKFIFLPFSTKGRIHREETSFFAGVKAKKREKKWGGK